MLKITYLYHSGFCVELNRHILIFDYYKGRLPELTPGKEADIFVSHKHRDHFNMDILKLEGNTDTRAFLGNDIKLGEAYLRRNGIPAKTRIQRVSPGQIIEEEGLRVEALRSTDAGVAFVVEAEGKSIYHAGDLNHWYWSGESRKWNDKMEVDYKREIDKLKNRCFDVAFVPLDPRLEEGYHLGLDYFLQNTVAYKIFPMHMWDDYGVIARYKQTETGKLFKNRIEEVSDQNNEFVIS